MGREGILRGIILVILLFIAAIFIYKGIFIPIDDFGTKEINLVKTNGNTFCQSCMGLYK